MTRDEAMRAAKKRWGAKALIKANGAVTSPERREEARASMIALRDRLEKLQAERKARLDALDWLSQMNEEIAAVRKEKEAASYRAGEYRFLVGYDAHGFAFHVSGQGDTWEQAFAAADKGL